MRKNVIGAVLLMAAILSGCAVNNVSLSTVPIVDDLTDSSTEETTTEELTSTDDKIPDETAGAVDNNDSVFGVDMDYPTIGDDVIDKLLKDCINEFDVMNRDSYYTDLSVYVSGDYDVIWQNDDMYSIMIEAIYYVHNAPHPEHCCYGLTINLAESKVVMLDEVIPSVDYIIEQVRNGNYEVKYGSLAYMTEEEIVSEVLQCFKTEDFTTYKDNFYMDNEFVYVIVDDVIGSDYGVLKFNK